MTRTHSKKENEAQKAPKIRRRAGMKVKMFAYLALFSFIVLGVIWLFQITLLKPVYRSSVRRQTEGAARSISSLDTDSGGYQSNVYDIASRYGLCVSVFKIAETSSGKTAEEIVRAHTANACIIHSTFTNEGLFSELYAQALQSGDGTCLEELGTDSPGSGASFICAALKDGDGAAFLTVVNKNVQPVDATVATLRLQMIYISLILICVSALAAYIISSRVTRPVAAMNEEAKKLAKGDYNVNFSGGSYLETCQLAGTLNYAAEELSKLDTMQKELIGNISHDLRTPLTMIAGYSEVMRDIPGEMTAENMQIVIDETNRLSSLVNDMLDLSRLTGGKREIRRILFSLTECVRETVRRFSKLKSVQGYTVTFTADRDVYVNADETLILQVIYNLVSNAVNYTGDDKSVEIRQDVKDGICRITVSDTGDGIPSEKLPYIWDRYYRTGDFHKRAVCGTGLGLSIVKGALILHGAQFGVSSTVGKGSSFWFELPEADAPDSTRSGGCEPSENGSTPTGTKSIGMSAPDAPESAEAARLNDASSTQDTSADGQQPDIKG